MNFTSGMMSPHLFLHTDDLMTHICAPAFGLRITMRKVVPL